MILLSPMPGLLARQAESSTLKATVFSVSLTSLTMVNFTLNIRQKRVSLLALSLHLDL